ncbi:MAG: EamA family transporter RarD [Actinobacteria bacterium]|nr:EamA family transporter RarD [Actinomycetota bacterium]
MNISLKNRKAESELSQGLTYGILAYFIWGVVPIYWPHLQPATPLEILAHRIVWSLLFLAILCRRKIPKIKAIFQDSRTAKLLVLASCLISVNWGLFIWASVTKHLLDSSLGYFITPLLSVGLGVFFLKERLRNLQWVAIAIAASAVIYLTVSVGAPPWLALALAFSFGIYGYVKKLANVPAIESLAIETLILAPVALSYLVWLEVTGSGTFGHRGLSHTVWLATSGIVTAVPLMLFGAATIRVPLSTMGMLQYLGPSLQYLIGLQVFHEAMPDSRFVSFVVTWLAIAIFTFDAIQNRRIQAKFTEQH